MLNIKLVLFLIWRRYVMNISEAVNYILKSYNKEYKNLEDAKIEIEICGYKYCYDAMSLGQYYSSLPIQLLNDLYRDLKL